MIRKRKKSRRKRGSSTGRGNSKRARGAGNRGGRGRAGYGKRAGHKKTMLRNKPSLKDDKGFRSTKQIKGFHPKSINVGELDKLSFKIGNEINLAKLGYDKLLGKGQVRNKLIIVSENFSESAKVKIEKAGGKIISEKASTEKASTEKLSE